MIVTVVYALPDTSYVVPTEVAEGTTVAEAIAASGLLQWVPALDPAQSGVGVWNYPVALDTVVHDGDRIEVYRPLAVDPKEARRVRARIRKRRSAAR